MSIIIAIGIFQAFICFCFLAQIKNRDKGDFLLLALLACIAMHLSIKFIIFNFQEEPHVRKMMNTFTSYGYGPLLYLFVLQKLNKNLLLSRKLLLLSPFFLASIFYFSTLTALTIDLEKGLVVLNWYNFLSIWTLLPFNIVLSAISLQQSLKSNFAPDTKTLCISMSMVFFITNSLAFSYLLFSTLFPIGDYSILLRTVIYSFLLAISVLIIRYRFIHTEPVLANGQEMDSTATLKEATNKKRRELLNEQKMKEIWERLEWEMQTKEYYKDAELTLDKLANLMQINKYRISETLNHYVNKPFYTYVNEYRVNYFKNRIYRAVKNDLEVNMLTSAYAAGFNSKSTFNKYFKEITGLTPTSFYKQIGKLEEKS